MAVTAGYSASLRIRTSAGAGTSSDDLVVGTSQSFERHLKELEAAHFGDSVEKYIMGLAGAKIEASFDWDSSDTAVGRLQTAIGDRSSVYAVVLRDGTNGWNVECKVQNLKFDASAPEKQTGSVSLIATGAVSTVP